MVERCVVCVKKKSCFQSNDTFFFVAPTTSRGYFLKTTFGVALNLVWSVVHRTPYLSHVILAAVHKDHVHFPERVMHVVASRCLNMTSGGICIVCLELFYLSQRRRGRITLLHCVRIHALLLVRSTTRPFGFSKFITFVCI